jgi:NADH-quinone oxidoreductase subunit J
MSEPAFYALAAAILASGAGVIVLSNPVHCALALIATLFLVAVAFAALGAHLVAALQIIIYAGAVVVLFLFVIMLLSVEKESNEGSSAALRVAAVVAASTMGLTLGRILWSAWSDGGGITELPADFGRTTDLARLLFREHALAFELTSVLLLVAVVGAIVLARRESD